MSSTAHLTAPHNVVIIGAGLGGMTLALALKKYGIAVKIFELRTPDYDFGGAIMLSPNALRVLDSIGAYERIRNKGFNFETLTFKTDHDHKTTGTYYFGHEEMYGYKALRIHRTVLIAELQKLVQEGGISIEYGKKYSHIVSETPESVIFALADGTQETADFLIGADGIHSKVRQYMLPLVSPTYSGFLGVTYAFPRSKLRLPADQQDYPFPASIHGKNGAFVMAPQNADGAEMFAGRQFKYPMQERSGWDALLKERNELIEMLQGDMEQWSPLVQSGLRQASESSSHSLNIWPFHGVPKLETWSSEHGRVVIVGDAAHAIPPTAGQGANQAFEDAYSLAILLASLSAELDLKKGLMAWQRYRQDRIEKVLQLTEQMNNIRLPDAEKKLLPREKVWQDGGKGVGDGGQLGWLYLNDIAKDMIGEISKITY